MHGATLRSPRLRRVHDLLADGAERSTREIVESAHVCAVNSCVAELRALGAQIECRLTVGPDGRRWFLYRMSAPAPAPTSKGTA